MSKIFFDVGLSLDGYIAGENRGPNNPLGDNGTSIHAWIYKQKAFLQPLGVDGGEVGTDNKLMAETFARTGAHIMGMRMFEEGEKRWPEDLFMTDVFVLTNKKRDPWKQKGTTTFYFINDGIVSALEKSKKSAGEKDVRIMGGAKTLQLFLNAGYIDEFAVHISPVLIGDGLRLFDHVDRDLYNIKIDRAVHSPLTTHIYYTLTKRKR